VTGTRFGIDFTKGLPGGHDQSWVLFVAANREVTSVIRIPDMSRKIRARYRPELTAR
jgi:hypothetical protein